MKQTLTLFLLLLALVSNAQVQHTITLRPGPSNGFDATIHKESNSSLATDENIIANAWTAGSSPVTLRSLFKFAMPTLPANATYVSATLTLFGNPTSNHTQLHSSYPGSGYNTTNEGWLMRLTAAWNPATVTWTNQPSTAVNVISLPVSTSQTEDYVINVTNMVKEMLDSPAYSYGFGLRLQNETNYRALVFASSDHPDFNRRPKLVINYTTPTPTGIAGTTGADEGISVYPNPVLHMLYVDFTNSRAANIKLLMTDVAGRTALSSMQQIAPNGRLNLDVSVLPCGLYFLRVHEDDKPVYCRTISVQ